MKQSEVLDMITKIQLAQQAMESACKRIDELKEENKNLKEALAKQEQGEPFGWYDMEHGEIRDVEWNRQKPIYEGVWRPLYTTPQQPSTIVRTWVGLTDGDLSDVYNSTDWNITEDWGYERALEAKLKEKNT